MLAGDPGDFQHPGQIERANGAESHSEKKKEESVAIERPVNASRMVETPQTDRVSWCGTHFTDNITAGSGGVGDIFN